MIDIKDKVTPVEKMQLQNVNLEVAVLKHLLEERQNLLQALGRALLERLHFPPQVYNLVASPRQNKWEVQVKPDNLLLPGVRMN